MSKIRRACCEGLREWPAAHQRVAPFHQRLEIVQDDRAVRAPRSQVMSVLSQQASRCGCRSRAAAAVRVDVAPRERFGAVAVSGAWLVQPAPARNRSRCNRCCSGSKARRYQLQRRLEPAVRAQRARHGKRGAERREREQPGCPARGRRSKDRRAGRRESRRRWRRWRHDLRQHDRSSSARS